MIYTSEARGSDESGDGSRDRPFKSVLQALRAADGKEPLPTIKVDAKAEEEVSSPLDERGVLAGRPAKGKTSMVDANVHLITQYGLSGLVLVLGLVELY